MAYVDSRILGLPAVLDPGSNNPRSRNNILSPAAFPANPRLAGITHIVREARQQALQTLQAMQTL
jgi:hypothetical protein